jgi:hypothetical protein
VVLNQNGNRLSQLACKLLSRFNYEILISKTNIGMLEGWKFLSCSSSDDYLLILEDDWFCDSRDPIWLSIGISILEENADVQFVKLRNHDDLDNYGKGRIEHEPWTQFQPPKPPDFEVSFTSTGEQFYKISSTFTGFTFNPILIRRRNFVGILGVAQDNPLDPTPLRSGENSLDSIWRSSSENTAAVINGPFKHTGFHNKKNYFWPMPAYVLRYLGRSIFR